MEIPNEPEKKQRTWKQVCINVTPEIDEIVKFAGDGNRSKGVRELARLFVRLAEESK